MLHYISSWSAAFAVGFLEEILRAPPKETFPPSLPSSQIFLFWCARPSDASPGIVQDVPKPQTKGPMKSTPKSSQGYSGRNSLPSWDSAKYKEQESRNKKPQRRVHLGEGSGFCAALAWLICQGKQGWINVDVLSKHVRNPFAHYYGNFSSNKNFKYRCLSVAGSAISSFVWCCLYSQ